MSTLYRQYVSAGPFLTEVETEKNGRSGTLYTYTYEGTLAEVEAKRRYVIALGASRTVIAPAGQGHFQLKATTGDQSEQPTDTHELEVNQSQPSIYTSPKLRNSLTDAQIAAVKLTVSEWQSNVHDTTTAAEAALTARTSNSTAMKLFKSVAYRGIESFVEYNNVYRRSITFATPRAVQASYVGVGQIWTSAEVTSWERIPPNGWFNLPTAKVWLKSPPHIVTVAYQHTEITYSYTGADYASALVYDAFNSATLIDT